MSERFEEVKSIGDAGDSMPNCLDVQEATDNPVCDMVRCIRLALHCGDHQSLKMALDKLEVWKSQKHDNNFHNYWRVAQLTGETELKSVYILLTVTSDKPENVRWSYLQDALAVLDMCLCNREIISMTMTYANGIQPVLSMALDQDHNEAVSLRAMSIISKMLIVCRVKFAKCVLVTPFLDAFTSRMQCTCKESKPLIEMCLQVVKGLLLCAYPHAYDYAVQVIHTMSEIFAKARTHLLASIGDNPLGVTVELLDFYEELVRSVKGNASHRDCAAHWTKGKTRKELLQDSLHQPWLYVNCSWPPCSNHNGIPKTFFRKCAACSIVRYCSRQCQTKHWESGHNIQCKFINNRNKSM